MPSTGVAKEDYHKSNEKNFTLKSLKIMKYVCQIVDINVYNL